MGDSVEFTVSCVAWNVRRRLERGWGKFLKEGLFQVIYTEFGASRKGFT